MFSIFSLIDNIPTIYQIHTSEISAKQFMVDIVKNYIVKRNSDLSIPQMIELSEVKLDTFSKYPSYTYLSCEDKIDIYQHNIIDKIEKGWVWNGLSKKIESKKIGIFQVLPVTESVPLVSEDMSVSKPVLFQIETIINEMIEEISNANHSINEDIEDMKNLRFDIEKHIRHPSDATDDASSQARDDFKRVRDSLEVIELDYSFNETPSLTAIRASHIGSLKFPSETNRLKGGLSVSSGDTSSPIDIPYQSIKYPEQRVTTVISSDEGFEDYRKKMMLEFKENFLPFEEIDSEAECLENGNECKINQKDINVMTYTQIENSEINEKNNAVQRCRSSRRGTKSMRSNYNLRKMRMRAY
jgi:FtsZ-binding cell division protein ZapB